MKRALVCIWFLLSVLTSGTAAADAGVSATPTSATSADLVKAAITGMSDKQCLQWQVVGGCFWLKCVLWKCSIKTSVKIKHYLPDLAVSSYHNDESHPWSDYGRAVASASKPMRNALLSGLGDAAGTRTRENPSDAEHTDDDIRYREGDAIGHPYAAVMGSGAGMFLCPSSAVTAYRPYMLTMLDALPWRAFWPTESVYPATWIPGLREIGSWPLNTWGNLFPRTGWALQQHDVKASAIVVSRMGDIVTRSGEPHAYTPVEHDSTVTRSGYRVWLPPSLVEGNASTGVWQLEHPTVTSCMAFGQNDSVSASSWGDGWSSADSGYIWALWRPYRCCQKVGNIFLGSFGS